MLIIRRYDKEDVVFADRDGNVRLRMKVRIHKKNVQLLFSGDPEIRIYREEIVQQFLQKENEEKND